MWVCFELTVELSVSVAMVYVFVTSFELNLTNAELKLL